MKEKIVTTTMNNEQMFQQFDVPLLPWQQRIVQLLSNWLYSDQTTLVIDLESDRHFYWLRDCLGWTFDYNYYNKRCWIYKRLVE